MPPLPFATTPPTPLLARERLELPAGLFMGTCSWKYPSWAGLVYASASKGTNFLQQYSRVLPTVEVDQWFWSLHGPGKVALPRLDTVLEYKASVPTDFRFTVKAPNSVTLTHFRSPSGQALANPDFLNPLLFEAFVDSIAPLAGQMGPVMLQFEYLNRGKMPGLDAFLTSLAGFVDALPGPLPPFPLGVEVRNPNYLVPEYFQFLHQRQLVPVFCEGYYMPPVLDVLETAAPYLGGDVVLRLMGPDREGIEERMGNRWDRILEPRPELPGLAGRIRDLLARNTRVYVNVNNHYEGCAPLTIRRLATLL